MTTYNNGSNIKTGEYVDYKGNRYTVISVAKDVESGDDVVVYTKVQDSQMFVMPVELFQSKVMYNNQEVYRFSYVDSNHVKASGNAQTNESSSRYKTNYQPLFQLISDYLTELKPDSVSMNQLREYDLSEYVKDMKQLCRVYFSTIQDYQFMPNVIGFNDPERRKIFDEILFDCDHIKILQEYDDNSLFEEFCKHFPIKNKESKSNSWRRYAKGIISICEYISQFDDIDEYNRYCDSFKGDVSLPEEMSSKISGMGFALACNLLKDIGFNDYSKPDVHLKDVLSQTGYCERDDYSILNCIREIADANNVKAHTVDSRIWLICSGYYYKQGISISSHKEELIKKINSL